MPKIEPLVLDVVSIPLTRVGFGNVTSPFLLLVIVMSQENPIFARKSYDFFCEILF